MQIALLGDIASFGAFSIKKNSRIIQSLKEIADFLEGFDFVVGNLEAPFSQLRKTYGDKSAYIYSEPENIKILQYLHINAVTLANNHIFDFGDEGYELTKRLLSEAGIEWFGSEGKELYLEINGNKIAFAGYCCYTTNPIKCVDYGGYGVNAYNFVKAEEFIKKSSIERSFPIVAVHAGTEHVNYPSLEHVRVARKLADVSQYVYYGHHPHVIQGLEEYNGSLIAHSLGNFCFDDVWTDASSVKPLVELNENNRTGMILELTIENSKLKSWKEQLIHIDNDGHIRLINKDEDIKEYNDTLRYCEKNTESYSALRHSILHKRISERKSQRSVSWYLKRLRPRYMGIILNARRNSMLYNENIVKYIK